MVIKTIKGVVKNMDIISKGEFCCPQCRSKNIQNFEMTYRMGISHIDTSTTGIGINSNFTVGIGIAETNGIQKSALSKVVQPPEKQSYLKNAMGLYFILLGITGLLAAGLNNLFNNSIFVLILNVLIVLLIPFYIVNHYVSGIKKWNEQEYPKLLRQWKQSYICFRCGHKFIVKR